MERLQYTTGSRYDFAKLVTPLVQQRAEALLVLVMRELLDRGRKVRVSLLDCYQWGKPARAVGCLDDKDWGKLTALVDGIQVCFDWTPVRMQRDKEYPQDRLCIRWSNDREATYYGSGYKPSSDCARLLEPKATDFDPLAVVEAFERWLVERKRNRREALARKAEIEARQKLKEALGAEAKTALPHMLGATDATVSVTPGGVSLHVHWNNLTASDAHALLATLQATHDLREDRKAAEAFAIPE